MIFNDALKTDLGQRISAPVLWDAPLSAWTTFRIGGPVDALVTVNDETELQSVLAFCDEQKTAWQLLGKGSNVLVSDIGVRGLIIVLGEGFKTVGREEIQATGKVVVKAGAALGLSRLGDWCGGQGLSGLEFAAGIPGTIGGAIVMNAGAWGTEIGDLVHQVQLVGYRSVETRIRKNLRFSYRCWDDFINLPTRSVITAVEFELESADSMAVLDKMRTYRRERLKKQPTGMPNAGSFFKNPDNASAGKLIENSGLKGLRIGDAEVSEKHANFFVNRGRATAEEMTELMRTVQEAVKRDSNIELEPEVRFL